MFWNTIYKCVLSQECTYTHFVKLVVGIHSLGGVLSLFDFDKWVALMGMGWGESLLNKSKPNDLFYIYTHTMYTCNSSNSF